MSTRLIRLGIALVLSGALTACEAADSLPNEPSQEALTSSNVPAETDAVDETADTEVGSATQGLFIPRKNLRIAIVGAGPSGLQAADTLQDLGYAKVTVFEKDNRVGGKVYSFRNGSDVAELGAIFASPDYKLVLGHADKYGIPYQAYGGNQTILDENGVRQTSQTFLASHYTTNEILAGTLKYAATLGLFASINLNGLAFQPNDLNMPFDEFAAKYGIEPITEVTRSILVGFGYGYYEKAPAGYFMKLLGWLVKVGLPNGLIPATYYTFPTGFQSVWEAVAQDLDVRLNSTVTKIKRRNPLTGSAIQITINNSQTYDFDVVIVSAALNKVGSFMELTGEENDLFSRVESLRYFVTVFGAANLVQGEALFFHNNAFPERINHTNVWANRAVGSPLYTAYQIADRQLTPNQVTGVLAQDVASQGGVFGQVLIRQEWDNYFPHFDEESFDDNVPERIELLQGKNNTFYVGGTLSFETVEHAARYSKGLVQKNFPPVFF